MPYIAEAGVLISVPSAPEKTICPRISSSATMVTAPSAVPLLLPKLRYPPPPSLEWRVVLMPEVLDPRP